MKKQVNKKPQDAALKGVTAELLSLRKDLQDFARHVDRAFVQAQATMDDRFQALETRMGQRFDTVDGRFDAVDRHQARLGAVAEDLSKIRLALRSSVQPRPRRRSPSTRH